MDSLAVIIADLSVNDLYELTENLNISLDFAKLELELAIEGLLIAVFQW